MKILVVGDIMLDHYIAGVVERQSPEAPIPILKQTNEWWTLGGAGNTAANIAELGAETWIFTSMGKDADFARLLGGMMQEYGIKWTFVFSEWTTVKTRFVIEETHEPLLRVDAEAVEPIDMFKGLGSLPPVITDNLDVIVIADYAKGVVTEELMDKIRKLDVPIIVDPKPVNAHLYKDVYMITPNEEEWDIMVEDFVAHNRQNWYEHIVKTCGRKGIEITDGIKSLAEIHSEEIDVVDVCGAGDTVTAVMTVCKAMNMNVLQSAKVACRCAEYVVTQPGTAPVPRKVFEEHLK